MTTARALWFELPDTYAQLGNGHVHARIATIVSETRHLDTDKRRSVDEQLKTAGNAGWQITLIDAGLLDKAHHDHQPAGHHYLSRAPRPTMRSSVVVLLSIL